MFVDNPVGTGYSYADTDSYVHGLDEMAKQFIVFLEKWFKLFPEYEHDDVSNCNPASFPFTHTHKHARTHTHTHTHSLSHSLARARSLSPSPFHTYTLSTYASY